MFALCCMTSVVDFMIPPSPLCVLIFERGSLILSLAPVSGFCACSISCRIIHEQQPILRKLDAHHPNSIWRGICIACLFVLEVCCVLTHRLGVWASVCENVCRMCLRSRRMRKFATNRANRGEMVLLTTCMFASVVVHFI